MKVLKMARLRAAGMRMNVRIYLPPRLLAQMRLRAAAEGIPLSDLFERAIRRFLEADERRESGRPHPAPRRLGEPPRADANAEFIAS